MRLLAVVLAAAPLLVAAFPWGEMEGQPRWSRVLWIPFVSGYRLKDVVLNILITVPIGLTSAAALRRHPLPTALGAAAGISAVCEWAQIYAPGRFPSGTDVFCNALGAAAGVFLLDGSRHRSARRHEYDDKDLPMAD